MEVEILSQKENSLYQMKMIGCPGETGTAPGSQVVAKVVKAYDNHRRLQIGDSAFAKVDDVECDDLFVNPDAETPQYQLGVVLGNDSGKESQHFRVSLRPSLVRDYQAIMDMSSKDFRKHEASSLLNGDLRSRMIKFGPAGLSVNMLVMGVVQNNCGKGCFIRVGHDAVVRAQPSELQQQDIPAQSLVLTRVIEVKPNGQVEVSNRDSIVVNGLLGLDKMAVNLKVSGRVVGFKGYRAIVQVDNTRIIAYVNVEDIDDPKQSLNV